MPVRELVATVKFFHPDKGYGFVTEEGTTEDFYLHRRCVEEHNLTTVNGGTRVAVKVEVKRGKPVVKNIVSFL